MTYSTIGRRPNIIAYSGEFNDFCCPSCSAPLSYFSGDKPQICFCCGSDVREDKRPVVLEDQRLLPLYIQSIAESLPKENARLRSLVIESTLVEEFYRMGTITRTQADKCKLELRRHFYGF